MIQALRKVDSYDFNLVYEAVEKALNDLDIMKDILPPMKVVIKPNLIMARTPDTPVTTHPAVVKAIVKYLRNNGIENITIAESGGGLYRADLLKKAYHICGLEDIEPDAVLNTDTEFVSVDCPKGFKNHSFNIIKPIAEADFVIDVCKLKTHAMTGMSGGIKNMFGTIPGLQKPQMHYRWPDIEDFSNMLIELSLVTKPGLTVIDAIDAMEGNGPTGGTSHPLNLLLASKDVYTQDYFAAGLMGIDPMEIVMIRQAVERGLTDEKNITIVGDEMPVNLTPFVRPDAIELDFTGNVPKFISKPFKWFAKKLLKSYPKLNPEKCIGCGKCAESCPAQLIKIVDKKAKFRKKDCISCFCCQEMCPMKAIEVKKAL